MNAMDNDVKAMMAAIGQRARKAASILCYASTEAKNKSLTVAADSLLAHLAMIQAAKTAGIEVLAFVPHVQAELKKQALDAGADKVVARSNFAQHLNSALM